MLGQRRRQWTNIGPVLGGSLVFAGLELKHVLYMYVIGLTR